MPSDAKPDAAARRGAEVPARFPSAVGKRAVNRLIAPASAMAIGCLSVLWPDPHPLAAGFGGVLLAAGFALAVLTLRARYVVDGDVLVIVFPRGGQRIPLSEIEGVRRRAYRDTWADHPMPEDLALGTDVIEIRSRNRPRLLVSPRDEEGFLAAIGRTARSPRDLE